MWCEAVGSRTGASVRRRRCREDYEAEHEQERELFFFSLTLLLPQVTIVDNVPSAPVSTEVDVCCILVKFPTYFILMGCGKLRTVVYFQKIIRQQK